ncbi:unnamed protein product, partial [Brassica napus]
IASDRDTIKNKEIAFKESLILCSKRINTTYRGNETQA